MPRETKTAFALPLTQVQVEMLTYVLEQAAMSEMPGSWSGAARRLKNTLLSGDPDPNVRRILDVSTAHLTVPERQRLQDGELINQSMTGEHGGMVYLSEFDIPESPSAFDTGNPRPADISSTLWAILQYATLRRCAYILFDCDAPFLPRFPVFESDSAN